ncbi:MAG: phosphoadenylyl-sulfate reductase [Bacteroidetes bacterium]|nr:phosphoadenylyl-sulfate reductase [Bacteroidota bacterium]
MSHSQTYLRADTMKDSIVQYNKELSGTDPDGAITYFNTLFPGRCVFSTSLGAEDQVLTEIIAASAPSVRIITLDTGRLFEETYELIRITEQKYNIKIEVCFPDHVSVERMVNSKGINLFYDSVENRKECCHVRKIEPLGRALDGMKAWITGLRREQSSDRAGIETVSWDETHSVLKLNPLINWTEQEVWSVIRSKKIPYNSLHDKGFPSIGCLPCTRAVMPGEHIRAGRWWWEDGSKKECGLHNDKK